MKKSYQENGGTPSLRLADYSARDEYWTPCKGSNRIMAKIQAKGDEKQQKRAELAFTCSDLLTYARHTDLTSDEKRLKLRHARFCRCRLCPLCQKRRSQVWAGRIHRCYGELKEKGGSVRYIHLVLTVKNCHVKELRSQIQEITAAFNRLMVRMKKNGTVMGFIRSIEVTREMLTCKICAGDYRRRSDCPESWDHQYTENCHPHVHVLVAVKSTYFNGDYYLTHDDWALAWQKALKVDYKPVVWVETIKPRKGVGSVEDALAASVKEVVKYCVKLDKEFFDHIQDKAGEEWFLELDRQLSGTRAIGLGGLFKEVLKDCDPSEEEMILADQENEDELLSAVEEFWQFNYDGKRKDYFFKRTLTEVEVEIFEKQAKERKEKKIERAKVKVKEITKKEELVVPPGAFDGFFRLEALGRKNFRGTKAEKRARN